LRALLLALGQILNFHRRINETMTDLQPEIVKIITFNERENLEQFPWYIDPPGVCVRCADKAPTFVWTFRANVWLPYIFDCHLRTSRMRNQYSLNCEEMHEIEFFRGWCWNESSLSGPFCSSRDT
jgi:hypothetical protein